MKTQNIFVNDIYYSAGSSSLRPYADDTTQFIVYENPCTLETTLNQDMETLTHWITTNYLQVNATKTWATTLGKSHALFLLVTSASKLKEFSRFSVTLDRDLSFKSHVAIMLKKAYA